MEPQDTPPYAPLPGDEVASRRSDPAATPSRPSTAAPRDDAARTRRIVAVAAGASFFAAMGVMAIARSGSSSASTSSTTQSSPGVTVPQQPTDDDGNDGFTFDGPRAAQPGVPSFDDGGQTQSRGS